jgi:hypothetical protein
MWCFCAWCVSTFDWVKQTFVFQADTDVLREFLCEFLWFRFHLFGGTHALSRQYEAVESFQRDLLNHNEILETFIRIYPTLKVWCRGVLFDPDFQLLPGIRWCVKHKLDSFHHWFKCEKMTRKFRRVIFHGTEPLEKDSIDHLIIDQELVTTPCSLYSEAHLALGLVFSEYRSQQDRYTRTIESIDSFSQLQDDPYFDISIFQFILRDYIMCSSSSLSS